MANTTYFGFAVADSMFPSNCTATRRPLSIEEVRGLISGGEVTSCLNPSHAPTIAAMRGRFGLDVPVPEKAPQVALKSGDSIIVMSVRGLPRLEGRHEYTEAEITSATFTFGRWTVQ